MRINFSAYGFQRGRIKPPTTIKSGKLNFSAMSGDKAKSAMSDEYVEEIKAIAREDAKADKYMEPGGRFNRLCDAQRKRYVSPDRAKAIAGASRVLNRVSKFPKAGKATFHLHGQAFKGIVYKGWLKTTAEVYDDKGQMIAGYTGVGWTDVPTPAESQFDSDSVQIYFSAYKAAKAEINASQRAQSIAGAVGIDVKA